MSTEESRKFLPPISILQSFQMVARYNSISRAAAEVGLTQSAVSRQILQLEDWLGQPLFDRAGRRVALNDVGRRYAEGIAPALNSIRHATKGVMAGPAVRPIELATLPSFGMRWLAPRLGRLSARHPQMIVNTIARSDEFDFETETFDAAIHVGRADWPGVQHDLLFQERVVPVVSPQFVARYDIRHPRDFLSVPLLVQSRRPDAWRDWFGLSAIAFTPARALPTFSHFLMLAQAVLAGAGAALLPSFLIQPEMEAGSLVVPVDLSLNDDHAYWFVTPPERLEQPSIRQLRAWILEEASMDSQGPEKDRPTG